MHGKVLVVEDEAIIRWLAMDFVSEAGLTPLEAEDADQALALLESAGDIDIVFTDVRMPGSIDGLALARVVRDRWPHIHVFIGSGHGTLQLAHDAGAERFFEKPYQSQILVSAFKELSGRCLN